MMQIVTITQTIRTIRLTNRQLKETAKFCLDIAKMILGVWVFGIFFQENFGTLHLFLLFWGLLMASMFFIFGLSLLKGVK